MGRHALTPGATRKRGLQKRTHGGKLRLGSIASLAAPTSAVSPGQPGRATIFYRGEFDWEVHRAIEALRQGQYTSTRVKLLVLTLAYPPALVSRADNDPSADATLARYNVVLQRLGLRYEAGLLVCVRFGVDCDYWRAALFIDRSIQSATVRETLSKSGIPVYSAREPDTMVDLVESVISVPVGPTRWEIEDFKALSKLPNWPELPTIDSDFATPLNGIRPAHWETPPETAYLNVHGAFDRNSCAAMTAAAQGTEADHQSKFIYIGTAAEAVPEWDMKNTVGLHEDATEWFQSVMRNTAVAYSSGIFSHVFWRHREVRLQIWRAIVEVPREFSTDQARDALTKHVGQPFVVRQYCDAREMIGWMLRLVLRIDDQFIDEWIRVADADSCPH